MTTTLAVFRQLLEEETGLFHSGSATSAGAADGTTVVDTALASRFEADALVNRHVRLTSGTYSGQTRRVSTNTTSVITPVNAYGGQVASGVTYEILEHHPDIIQDALNRAVEDAFPWLYLPLRNETLVADNLLSNSDFETFSNGFTGWTEVGSPTVTQHTTRVIHGSGSASVVAGAAAGQLTQNLFSSVNIHEIAGKPLYFKGWAWASAASAARLRVTFNGSTYTNSSWHGGQGEWEGSGTMYVAVAVPTTATQMTCICEAAANQTGIFDALWAAIDPVYRLTIPSALLHGPHHVRMQYDGHKPNGPYYPLGNGVSPIRGRFLRLEGMGLLSRPTTDAGTYEVDPPRTRLVVALAASWLFRLLANLGSDAERVRNLQTASMWAARAEQLKREPGMKMQPMSADLTEAYHVEEDSSGRYLVFDAWRGR